MPSLNKVLNVAKLALETQRFTMNTASHNIANVNTDGYTRQKVMLGTNTPDNSSIGFVGSGVRAVGIQRIQDKFLGIRINSEVQIFGELEQKSEVLKQAEIIFNDSQEVGLNNTIDKFFNSWNWLSSNASVSEARTGLVNSTQTMTTMITKMDADLSRLRSDTDNKVRNLVGDINDLTSQIATLNDQIHQLEIGNTNANDLRDQRDLLIKELSQKINIDTFENNDNIVNIVTSSGYSLVERISSTKLTVTANQSDASVSNINWQDSNGTTTDVTNVITGGELAALVELRDTTIKGYSLKLGKIAAGVVNEVNKIHYASYDLNQTTGINFFNPLDVAVTKDSNNSGSPTVTASVVDPSSLLRDDFKITIASGSTFTLQNTTRNSASGTYTFASGTSVLLSQGLSVTITGAATAGDVYELSVNKNAARDMAINPDIVADVNRISVSMSGESNDGESARLTAALRTQSIMVPNTSGTSATYSFTLQDFYSSLVSEIGSDTKTTATNFGHQEGIVNQLENLKESVTGVSVDEEMINIVSFQRAFQAASRLIGVVDEMLGRVIDLVK